MSAIESEKDELIAFVKEAAICEHSGTRIHVMDVNGTCEYCRKPLALVALD